MWLLSFGKRGPEGPSLGSDCLSHGEKGGNDQAQQLCARHKSSSACWGPFLTASKASCTQGLTGFKATSKQAMGLPYTTLLMQPRWMLWAHVGHGG